jgi:Protein of unknown function (DUF4089)
MTDRDVDTDALIDAMAAYLNVPIKPEHRLGIALNLRAAHQMAQGLLAVELPDEAEPGPVFVA